MSMGRIRSRSGCRSGVRPIVVLRCIFYAADTVQCAGPAARPSVERLKGVPKICAEFGQLIFVVVRLRDEQRICEIAKPLIEHARGHPLTPREERSRANRAGAQLPHDPQGPATPEQIHRCHDRAPSCRASHGVSGPRRLTGSHRSNSHESRLTFRISKL